MTPTSKPNTESSRAPNETARPSPLSGLRVLVVEDVGMVAVALKSMLKEIGCTVVGTPARLYEAEEMARNEKLDGVLLDLNLAGQYAYTVADILRERGIPYIIMSGYDVGQLRPQLAKDPCMQKPFEREPLEAMIRSIFCTEVDHDQQISTPPSGLSAPEPTKAAMKTRGELESAVCQGMCQFQQEYIGRGPSDIRAHLIQDMLVVRLHGVLTAAEQHIAKASSAEQGRDLLKRVKTLLIETARLQIDSMIQVITGARVISMHHDISTITGEEIVVFTLDRIPAYRESRQR